MVPPGTLPFCGEAGNTLKFDPEHTTVDIGVINGTGAINIVKVNPVP
jgi:hypothetical protein